jgi:PA14 domain
MPALRQDTTSSSFSEATLSGSLLVCVVVNVIDHSTSPTQTINTPSTSGFTWTLGNSENYEYSTTVVDTTYYYGSEVAIYYIAGASSMSTGTTTSCTADQGTVTFRMYEFTGVAASSPKDTSGVEANSSGSSSTVTAGNLTTSFTDLIFVASAGGTTAGSGYTSGAVDSDQYILNQASGTVSTAFGNAATYWAAVGLAFKSGSVTVTPGQVDATFGINNPTISYGWEALPAQVGATFGIDLLDVYVPFPGAVYPGQIGATFGVGTVTTGTPINYGNVVSGSNSLPSGVNTTYFYVRWTGWLSVDVSGTYTIGLNVGDGGDLYIGTQPIVLELAASQSANSTAEYTQSAQVELTAGVAYPMVVEWQHGGGAHYECQLLWTPPGGSVEVIPSANLELSGYWQNASSGTPYPNTWYNNA